MAMGWGENHGRAEKVSVDDWIARRQHLRRRVPGKEVILQWVPAVVVVCAIMATMAHGRRCRLRDLCGDDYLRRGLIHEREIEKNEVAQDCHPLAHALLLASPDPLAEATEGAPGWQTCLADDATGLRWHVRPTDRRPASATLAR